ncbi:DNA internalization-related competence protein ComEC/Rec2 [Paucibacter sp. M5-1]|uniref:DNA internalization-related competence protein ComEC/Rec2 n=1 Tax=Paucibacter sp. M5-1 TaxID=3015998 RepID=UPI0022B91EF5|nr:DNA internalization-related competence protein ComEC/Rec2 [Paucibacter sp. M5-1]MCZ7882936.1 DNA internalization-related competence protein ComEC/Rec2 [Paucibacter sp. M5-1]
MPDAWRTPHSAVLALLAWLAGLAALQQCARLPEARELAAVLLLAAALAGLALLRPRAWPRGLLLALSLGLLAFGQGAWRAQQRLDQALPAAWEGRDLLLSGRIASLPQAVQGQGGLPGRRFVFMVERAEDPQRSAEPQVPPRLLLSAYAQPGVPLPDWRAGDHWQLLVRLRRPHGLSNPHAFDYELWLFEQGLRATGVLRPGGHRLLEAGGAWRIDRWRQRLRDAIQRHVPDPGAAGVLVALSLGEQAAITRTDWSLFRDTGISHLVAISGLHITMFAWAAGWAVAGLWCRSARSCLWLPAPRAGLWAGVGVALAYALFSGWGVPAQRTVWMLLTLALLRQLGLRWPWPLSLLLAACVVTAIDPWAISQAGFWLSFVAVGLLMASGPGLLPPGWRAQLGAALHSQWVATLGLAPLTLLFFQQISAVGLLANLVAIPVVSLLITPLALAGSLVPLLWDLAVLCLQGLMLWLRWLAGLPWAVWHVPVAPLWAQVCGLLAALLLVLPLPWGSRLLGLPLALGLLWPAVPRPAPGQLELLAADVGQGTAVLLRTANHSLLYDSGAQYTPQADAGQRVLLPLLRALGVRELDLLLLSHRDQDHVGGAAALLAGLPVRALLSSLDEGHVLLAAGAPQRRCERGLRWRWDGVDFEILHPQPADYRREAVKPNALSCVLKVRAGARGVLLSGDIEAAQEQSLLGLPQLPSDLLMLAHHGSQTSSTPAFLDAVAPRQAFVQAGYRNRFGHPAPAVLARLQARGVPVWNSADCGALRWRSDAPEPSCQRELGRRYWQRTAVVEREVGLSGADDQGF